VAHPEGYHKTAAARERCYGCSAPEILEPTKDDIDSARRLIVDGFIQVSNKYRTVARVRLPASGVAVAGNVPSWARDEIMRHYESLSNSFAYLHGERRVLTAGQFAAFKMLMRGDL